MTQPITEIFAWIIDDPTGQHGILGVMGPDGLPMQAVSSKRHLITSEMFRKTAQQAVQLTGLPIRLKRFVVAETVESIKP